MTSTTGGGKPTVAVTGASGLVGSHLVNHLVGQGFNVVAVMRGRSNESLFQSELASGRLTVRISDVLDPEGMQAAFEGVDVVVHTAGTVDALGPRKQIFDTNVEGSRIALDAAKIKGVKHFIFISSLSVITGQGDQYDVDESAPLTYCGESYADSKVDAEKLVMAVPPSDAMKVTALRPGFIYGPRERAWMPRLINSISTGKAMLIDGGTKETNVIYVGNLSRAIEGAILNEKAYGRVYNLTDGEKTTKKQLFDAIADGLGLPRVTKVVPGAVARAVCEVVSSLAPLLPEKSRRNLSRFSRAAFRLAGVNQGFSIKRAESDLGYVNRVPFAEGMRITLDYFKSERKQAGQKEAKMGAGAR
ncbi:MAG TPA: NAD-dependent epimerase/dehydratase family protein [Candidatus Obscuribacterales bacterium]